MKQITYQTSKYTTHSMQGDVITAKIFGGKTHEWTIKWSTLDSDKDTFDMVSHFMKSVKQPIAHTDGYYAYEDGKFKAVNN